MSDTIQTGAFIRSERDSLYGEVISESTVSGERFLVVRKRNTGRIPPEEVTVRARDCQPAAAPELPA